MAKKRILLLRALIVAMLFATYHAEACRCYEMTLAEEYKASEAVFVGRLKRASRPTDFDVEYTFEVLRSWKGKQSAEVTVHSASSPKGCGFQFSNSQDYLIVAHASPKGLSVSRCGRTVLKTKASEQIKWLDEQQVGNR